MIKITISLFISLFLSQLVCGQNLDKIYTGHWKEDSLIDGKKYDQAIDVLSKSIKVLALKTFAELSLIKVNLLKGDFAGAHKHLYQGIIAGLDTDKLNSEPIIQKLTVKHDFKANYNKYRRLYNASLLYPDERVEILQMVERDQFLRGYVGRIDSKAINPVIKEVDSVNTVELKYIISKIGFPGVREVGIDGTQNLFTLLLHIFLDDVKDATDFAYFEPLIKKAIINGNFDPVMYAIVVDRYNSVKSGYQIYGTYWIPDQASGKRIITKIKDINEIDIRRAGIYLPPLINLKNKGYLLPPDYR